MKQGISEMILSVEEISELYKKLPNLEKNIREGLCAIGAVPSTIENVQFWKGKFPDMDKSKKAFQEWFEADAFPAESDWFKLDEDGEYDHAHTWIAWKAWQASKAWCENQAAKIK